MTQSLTLTNICWFFFFHLHINFKNLTTILKPYSTCEQLIFVWQFILIYIVCITRRRLSKLQDTNLIPQSCVNEINPIQTGHQLHGDYWDVAIPFLRKQIYCSPFVQCVRSFISRCHRFTFIFEINYTKLTFTILKSYF